MVSRFAFIFFREQKWFESFRFNINVRIRIEMEAGGTKSFHELDLSYT